MKPNRMFIIKGHTCMPCRMLEEWLSDHNLEVESIYGEDNMDICRKYQVLQTPSLVLVEDPVEGVSTYEAHQVISGLEKIIEFFEGVYKI